MEDMFLKSKSSLFLSLSTNSPSASGSCYVEMGLTKVLCSVYGPREATSSTSNVFGSSTSSNSSSSSSLGEASKFNGNVDIEENLGVAQAVLEEEEAHGILECTVQFAPFAKRKRSAISSTRRKDYDDDDDNNDGKKVSPLQGLGISQIATGDRGGGGGGGGGFDLFNSSIIEEERKMSGFLERSLTPTILLSKLPKSIVEVHVLVLEAGGNESEAAVIGTSMALVDAGVEVLDLCVGATVIGLRKKDTKQMMDISGSEGVTNDKSKVHFVVSPFLHGKKEEEEEVIRTSICMMMQRELLTYTLHEGAIEAEEIINALNVAMAACASSYQVMRETLIKRVQESIA
jgi:ribonuclease PH